VTVWSFPCDISRQQTSQHTSVTTACPTRITRFVVAAVWFVVRISRSDNNFFNAVQHFLFLIESFKNTILWYYLFDLGRGGILVFKTLTNTSHLSRIMTSGKYFLMDSAKLISSNIKIIIFWIELSQLNTVMELFQKVSGCSYWPDMQLI